MPEGERTVSGRVPFTPRTKKALELALRESLGAGSNVVASEQILLGLLRGREGLAARILMELDVDLDGLRASVTSSLSPPQAAAAATHRPVPGHAGCGDRLTPVITRPTPRVISQ